MWGRFEPPARDRNPWSKGMGAHYDEILTVSMLLGEHAPVFCSCCMGHGQSSGIFGIRTTCGQCRGWGYDILGPKTMEHFLKRVTEGHKGDKK